MKVNFRLSICRMALSMILLICSSATVLAQELVNGVVQTRDGEPLIGVVIKVVGDKDAQPALSDIDGKFSINVPNLNAKIATSYIGYESTVLSLNGRKSVIITMAENAKLLDEVVVVGYGVQKKQTVTGAIAQVNADELMKAPIGNITASLAGKLPGLVTTQKSGQPGENNATMKVRGVSTLGNSAPIMIVDDVERPFTNIDPNEIESITILKDATAAAVYGMRAAAGVILVKTKRGSNSKPKVTYSGKVAYNQNTNYPKFLNGPDFITWYNKARVMDGLDPMFSENVYDKALNGDPDGKIANTDWFGELMHDGAYSTQHNISVNGGNDQAKYFLSMGYLNENGIIDKIGFERFNFRSNIDVNLDHGISIGLDLSGQKNKNKSGYWNLGNQSWNNPLGLAQRMLPFVPTTYNGLPTAANIESVKYNPIAYNEKTGYNRHVTDRLFSTLSLGWDLPWVDGLSLKVKGSYDKDYKTAKAWRENFDMYSYNIATEDYDLVRTYYDERDKSILRNSVSQSDRLTIQPSITYNKVFNEVHDLSALFLHEQTTITNENLRAEVEGFHLTGIHELDKGEDILKKDKNQAITGLSGKSRRAGFVGRINYAYNNKYLLELVARYDGSMNFPKNKRWGFFPAASAGWRMTEEAFFKNIKEQLKIEDFKVRLSAGLLGNDRIKAFQYRDIVKANVPTVYIGDTEYISIYNAGDANHDITWEKTATYNVGFDLVINKGIFGIQADYFYKITRDILIGGGGIYPPSLGGRHPRTINGGKVSNRGVEFAITHKNRIGEVDYFVNANLGWSRNKVLRMNESENIPEYQKRTGRKMGQKLGFLTDGVYQTQEEINNSATLSHLTKDQIRPGDVKYVDINGDGRIDKNQDYVFVGNGNTPELMYGFNLGANWKNFDVSLFFQGAAITDVFLSGVYANDHVDQTQFTRPFFGNGNSPYFLIENSWTPENPNSEFARLSTIADKANVNGWASDFWMRSGNYLRLKNAQIGYTFRDGFIKKSGIDNIRVSITGGNLFTWSDLNKYNIDPEMPEITNGYYPQQRTYEFGVSVTF